MEKRLILAIVISFIVLFVFQALFNKKPEPEATTQESITEQIDEIEEQPSEKIKTPSVQTYTEKKEEKAIEPISAQNEKDIIIDTPLFYAVWSNKGAVLKSWRLKKHMNDDNEPVELVSEKANKKNEYPFSIETENPSFNQYVNNALYDCPITRIELDEGETREIRFVYADSDNSQIEKVFSFQGGTYSFDVNIEVLKEGEPVKSRLKWGPNFGDTSETAEKKRFGTGEGMAYLKSDKVKHISESKYDPEEDNQFFRVDWVAYENNYFAAIFLPASAENSVHFIREKSEASETFNLLMSLPEKVYLGPKDYDLLGKFGNRTNEIIKFGLFGFIGKILLKAIKWIHSFVPNWGFSIIILTIIIKLLFFPLTFSSTRSMSKMQELQPKIKAIKKKYKKAKQDIQQRRNMNEEIMKLYKAQGVNPAGGCLPILIQLPIFWGFFRLLAVSIEFRKSPFIFWIKDLSIPDPFYVTPILMGATQFIVQKMTPTSADSAQSKMMLIMPVVMIIFFMNFQSGLIIYWLTNNILQIGQQYLMNRIRKKKKRENHGKSKKGAK